MSFWQRKLKVKTWVFTQQQQKTSLGKAITDYRIQQKNWCIQKQILKTLRVLLIPEVSVILQNKNLFKRISVKCNAKSIAQKKMVETS